MVCLDAVLESLACNTGTEFSTIYFSECCACHHISMGDGTYFGLNVCCVGVVCVVCVLRV